MENKNIFFTGASSFTGMWFVKELVQGGYNVTISLLRPLEDYSGLRRERINQIISLVDVVDNCPFGSEKMLRAFGEKPCWEALCHHAADVTNYKSPHFDYVRALEKNTYHLKSILDEIKCKRVVLTGSVFEPSIDLEAVSPYGLSKGLTYETFRYFTQIAGIPLGKFVIPNPFGPYEEERFTTFLVKNWLAGKKAPVTHPQNVRDNIHVSHLAKAYLHFVNSIEKKMAPSGYRESQGDFARRFSKEMEIRLKIPCPIEILEQTDFSEPLVRLNSNTLNFDDKIAWDELAAYYRCQLVL